MDVSILIPSWNTEEYLRRCLESVYQTLAPGISFEVIVVDNHSSDGSAAMVRQAFPGVRLIENPANLGFTKAVNQALRAAQADFLLLLNSDIMLCGNAAAALLDVMRKDSRIDLLACQLLNPDGSVQFFCRRFPTLLSVLFENTFLQRLFPRAKVLSGLHMREWKHDDFREVDQPPGCLWLFRRRVVDEIGMLDERMFLFYSDVDYCLRMRRKGMHIYFTPSARAVHGMGVSRKKLVRTDPRAEFIWHADRALYIRKHFGFTALCVYKAVLATDFLLRTVESTVYLLAAKMSLKEWARQERSFCMILTR